jgi:hypothetical protein
VVGVGLSVATAACSGFPGHKSISSTETGMYPEAASRGEPSIAPVTDRSRPPPVVIGTLVLRNERLVVHASGHGDPRFSTSTRPRRVMSRTELAAEHPDLHRLYTKTIAGTYLDARVSPEAFRRDRRQ